MKKKYSAQCAYRDSSVAKNYDHTRFSSLKGKIGDLLDKRAIDGLLQNMEATFRVLDLACGTGRLTHFLVKKGYHCVGLDISLQMIQIAKNRLKKISGFIGLCQGSAEVLPFASESFDYITSIRFWGHIPRDERQLILSEVYRVSKRYFVVEVCIPGSISRIRRYWKKKIEQLRNRTFIEGIWEWHLFTYREIELELNNNGFKLAKKIPKLPFLSDAWFLLAQKE
jgi:ubiquinone/menaquinone biosynthesis C-methylase UbiE